MSYNCVLYVKNVLFMQQNLQAFVDLSHSSRTLIPKKKSQLDIPYATVLSKNDSNSHDFFTIREKLILSLRVHACISKVCWLRQMFACMYVIFVLFLYSYSDLKATLKKKSKHCEINMKRR